MRTIIYVVAFLVAVGITAGAHDVPTRTIGALVAVAIPIVVAVYAWLGGQGIVRDTDEGVDTE
jgi:Flp pilus assembly protein protease CpaA